MQGSGHLCIMAENSVSVTSEKTIFKISIKIKQKFAFLQIERPLKNIIITPALTWPNTSVVIRRL